MTIRSNSKCTVAVAWSKQVQFNHSCFWLRHVPLWWSRHRLVIHVCVCSKSWTWFMISDHYRLQMPWNLQFFLPFLLLCNIYLLPNQKVKFRCAVFPVLHTISKQLQGSPLHSRLRAIGGDPFRLFGVVNFASHFICFQISALPLILSASKNPSYNFRG